MPDVHTDRGTCNFIRIQTPRSNSKTSHTFLLMVATLSCGEILYLLNKRTWSSIQIKWFKSDGIESVEFFRPLRKLTFLMSNLKLDGLVGYIVWNEGITWQLASQLAATAVISHKALTQRQGLSHKFRIVQPLLALYMCIEAPIVFYILIGQCVEIYAYYNSRV